MNTGFPTYTCRYTTPFNPPGLPSLVVERLYEFVSVLHGFPGTLTTIQDGACFGEPFLDILDPFDVLFFVSLYFSLLSE
jgi:hypothetical protein